MSPDEIRALRSRLDLTQAAFASRYGLALRTLQGWEGGRSPSDVGNTLLKLIEAEPQLVADILARQSGSLDYLEIKTQLEDLQRQIENGTLMYNPDDP